jgi:hypothetical protein
MQYAIAIGLSRVCFDSTSKPDEQVRVIWMGMTLAGGRRESKSGGGMA